MKYRRRRFAVLFTVTALVGGASTVPAHAVSGGIPVTDGNYGFTAKIDMEGAACSGALVAPDWVITSASCFAGNPQGGLPVKAATVTVGRTNLAGTTGKVAKVTNLVAHASRGVMLVRLDTTITDIAPVSLRAAAAVGGEKVRLAGYGRTATEWVPDKLHSALFTVGTPTAGDVPLTGDNGADACKGDAGGPVFREVAGKVELVGVVGASWEHGCLTVTETQQGTTATRTDDLIDWVRDQIIVLATKANSHAITVSWSPLAPQDDAGYRLYAATTPEVPIDAAHLLTTTRTATFVHKSLRAKQKWHYRVVASTGDGYTTRPSATVSATTLPRPVSDFTGDGKDDIATFVRGTGGDVYVASSDGGKFVGDAKLWHDYFAVGAEVPLAGDFNGDGKTDAITFVRGTRGDVYVALSDGSKFGASVLWHEYFSAGAEIPVVGDFNGDGLSDIATFLRGTSGDAYVSLSDGTKFGPSVIWHDLFATGDQMPVIGDINGDGKDDVVAFARGGSGDVFVTFSDGTKFGAPAWGHESFAYNDEIPAVGDFNGDGRDDISTSVRGAGGDLYVALSDGARFGVGVLWHDNFGIGSEIPAVGDFNGDGKTDAALFKRSPTVDVLVAPSDGAKFGPAALWHDAFAYNAEVPVPRSILIL